MLPVTFLLQQSLTWFKLFNLILANLSSLTFHTLQPQNEGSLIANNLNTSQHLLCGKHWLKLCIYINCFDSHTHPVKYNKCLCYPHFKMRKMEAQRDELNNLPCVPLLITGRSSPGSLSKTQVLNRCALLPRLTSEPRTFAHALAVVPSHRPHLHLVNYWLPFRYHLPKESLGKRGSPYPHTWSDNFLNAFIGHCTFFYQLRIMYMIFDCLVSLLDCKLHVSKNSCFTYNYFLISKLMLDMQGLRNNYL